MEIQVDREVSEVMIWCQLAVVTRYMILAFICLRACRAIARRISHCTLSKITNIFHTRTTSQPTYIPRASSTLVIYPPKLINFLAVQVGPVRQGSGQY